jgi:cell division protein ZapA (FtsZ GTPase activity inhibitor)
MAALNIAHELLQEKRESHHSSQNISGRLSAMRERLDAASLAD